MNKTLAALAAVSLLASGCAHNAQVKPPAEPDDSSPVASATPSGASSAGVRQGSAGQARAEVYAEAPGAAKHH